MRTFWAICTAALGLLGAIGFGWPASSEPGHVAVLGAFHGVACAVVGGGSLLCAGWIAGRFRRSRKVALLGTTAVLATMLVLVFPGRPDAVDFLRRTLAIPANPGLHVVEHSWGGGVGSFWHAALVSDDGSKRLGQAARDAGWKQAGNDDDGNVKSLILHARLKGAPRPDQVFLPGCYLRIDDDTWRGLVAFTNGQSIVVAFSR